MPDSSKPYRVEVDASDFATGGILSQQGQDGQWHPAAYISKSLSETERNYDIYNKELLALSEHWKHGDIIWKDHHTRLRSTLIIKTWSTSQHRKSLVIGKQDGRYFLPVSTLY